MAFIFVLSHPKRGKHPLDEITMEATSWEHLAATWSAEKRKEK
jgi:hypothetical protein